MTKFSLKNIKNWGRLTTVLTLICLSIHAAGQEGSVMLPEINLETSPESTYFLNVIKNEQITPDKNSFNLELKEKPKGNVDFKINETSKLQFNIDERDENGLFSARDKESIDINAGFSQEVNSFMNINTDISLKNLNNYTDSSNTIYNLNISTDIIPDHKLYFGQVDIYDNNSASELQRSLRNQYGLYDFNSAEDIDLKLSKENGLINYSLGAYNINKQADELNKNASVSGGTVAVNPFKNYSGLGDLNLGGGYFTNLHSIENELDREDAYSVFSGYKYDRFSVRGEFLRKSNEFYEGQYSDSIYFSNKVSITDKLNLKGGIRQYEETQMTVNDVGFEYSLGKTPFFDAERLKFEFNASFIQSKDNGTNDSERYNIKTKFFF